MWRMISPLGLKLLREIVISWFFVLFKVKTEEEGDDLSEDSCACGTGDPESRSSKVTEDQDRIQDDIDDGAEALGVHGVDRLSGGLQETLAGDLREETEGSNRADS